MRAYYCGGASPSIGFFEGVIDGALADFLQLGDLLNGEGFSQVLDFLGVELLGSVIAPPSELGLSFLFICVVDSSPLLLHSICVPRGSLVRLDYGIGRELLEALYDTLRAF
jgi:hypothetical protein